MQLWPSPALTALGFELIKGSEVPAPAEMPVEEAREVLSQVAEEFPLAEAEQTKLVLLDDIGVNEQPRKKFDEAGLDELGASIKAEGLIQPLVLRPWEGGPKPFLLVAGERRWRACGRVGIDRVRCLIRPMTDAEHRRLQVVENLQRADLSPLEEAEAFHQLMEHDKMTGYQLAELVHKKPFYVYSALKLLRIPAKAREALEEGRLGRAVAAMIGRLEDREAREAATKRILSGGGGGQPMSKAQAVEFFRYQAGRPLAEALFPLTDETLVPRGACTTCLVRCHAAEDASGDVCPDQECFAAKLREWQTRETARYQAEGTKVLETKAIFEDWGGRKFNAGVVGLDDVVSPSYVRAEQQEAMKRKTWREVLGDDVQRQVVFDTKGRAVEVVPTVAALALAAKTTPKVFQNTPGTDYEAKEKARRLENIRDRRERDLKWAIEKAQEARFTSTLDARVPSLPDLPMLSAVAAAWLRTQEHAFGGFDGLANFEEKAAPLAAALYARVIDHDSEIRSPLSPAEELHLGFVMLMMEWWKTGPNIEAISSVLGRLELADPRLSAVEVQELSAKLQAAEQTGDEDDEDAGAGDGADDSGEAMAGLDEAAAEAAPSAEDEAL